MITQDFEEAKKQALSLLTSGQDLASKYNYSEQEKNSLAEATDHLLEDKLYVVVVGEFKEGKSSLINAYLEEPDICPVDVDIATSQESIITYSEQEKISIITKDETKVISREEIAKYVTEQGNKKNLQHVQRLLIEIPNEKLKLGLVIIDTPGTGGLNPQHIAVTDAILPIADAILFVVDAQAPLTKVKLDFLERVVRFNSNIIIVITKIDATSDYHKIVDDYHTKLKEKLSQSQSEIKIVPVSSLDKLEYLKSKDTRYLERSHFDLLESELSNLLRNSRKILIVRAMLDLAKVLTRRKEEINAELKAMSGEDKNQHDQKRLLEEEIRRLERFLQAQAPWRTNLNVSLKECRENLFQGADNDFNKIKQNLEKYLSKEEYLDKWLINPRGLIIQIQSEINGLIIAQYKKINDNSQKIYDDILSLLGLEYSNPFEPISKKDIEVEKEKIEIKTSSWWKKLSHVLSKAYGKASMGAILGGLVKGIIGTFLLPVPGVGTAAGAAVGVVIGGVAGLALGIMDGIDDIKTQDREAAKKELRSPSQHFFNDSKNQVSEELKKELKKLNDFIPKQIELRIREEIETCKRKLAAIDRGISTPTGGVPEKNEELMNELNKIQKLLDEAQKLIQSLNGSEDKWGDFADDDRE